MESTDVLYEERRSSDSPDSPERILGTRARFAAPGPFLAPQNSAAPGLRGRTLDEDHRLVSTELIDLSVPIVTGMPVYPGDPEVDVSPALTAAESGVNVQRLHLGSQTGTHVDAPFHTDDSLPRGRNEATNT